MTFSNKQFSNFTSVILVIEFFKGRVNNVVC